MNEARERMTGHAAVATPVKVRRAAEKEARRIAAQVETEAKRAAVNCPPQPAAARRRPEARHPEVLPRDARPGAGADQADPRAAPPPGRSPGQGSRRHDRPAVPGRRPTCRRRRPGGRVAPRDAGIRVGSEADRSGRMPGGSRRRLIRSARRPVAGGRLSASWPWYVWGCGTAAGTATIARRRRSRRSKRRPYRCADCGHSGSATETPVPWKRPCARRSCSWRAGSCGVAGTGSSSSRIGAGTSTGSTSRSSSTTSCSPCRSWPRSGASAMNAARTPFDCSNPSGSPTVAFRSRKPTPPERTR